jgi:branched-chain amino acid transport system permease protein
MRKNLFAAASVVIGVAVVALMRETLSSYALSVFALGLIAGALGTSLSLLVTYAGLPSLAQAAFYGTGGYAVGLLAVKAGQNNLWVGLFTSAGVSAALAALLGVISLRTRGIYFQIITLSFTAMLWGLAVKWRSLTGGDDGLVGILPPSLEPFGGVAVTPAASFTLAAAGLAFVVAVVVVVRRSAFGHVLIGIRDSESRMAALGFHTWWFKFSAFVLSGILAGIAGALLTYQLQFVSPAQLNFVVSIQALLTVVLGAGTLLGPAIAGVTVVWLQEILQRYSDHWLLVLGAIYVIVAVMDPAAAVQPIRRRVAARKLSAAAESSDANPEGAIRLPEPALEVNR